MLGLHKLEEAEKCLIDGFAELDVRREKIPAPSRGRGLREAVMRIVSLFEEKKDEAQIAKWRAKLDEVNAEYAEPSTK